MQFYCADLCLDSLVSSQVYEVIKTIYTSPDSSSNDATRVTVLQNTLGQLRLANIATLDAITTHFTRLIDLTSADEAYVTQLAQALAPCVLRPRQQSSLTMHEKHAYRLVRDLFDHKEEIFGELKRASSQNSNLGAAPRARTSTNNTDESNRRANMEARNRAIASRSRAASPAPVAVGPNGRSHRRDRSVDPAASRFPVVTSPTAESHPRPRVARHSLEVPDSDPAPSRSSDISPPTTESFSKPPALAPVPNGLSDHTTVILSDDYKTPEPAPENSVGVEKKNSLTRSGHVASAAGRINRKAPGSGSGSGLNMISRTAAKRDSASASSSIRDSVSSVPESSRTSGEIEPGLHGVQLTDKPMDD